MYCVLARRLQRADFAEHCAMQLPSWKGSIEMQPGEINKEFFRSLLTIESFQSHLMKFYFLLLLFIHISF